MRGKERKGSSEKGGGVVREKREGEKGTLIGRKEK